MILPSFSSDMEFFFEHDSKKEPNLFAKFNSSSNYKFIFQIGSQLTRHIYEYSVAKSSSRKNRSRNFQVNKSTWSIIIIR